MASEAVMSSRRAIAEETIEENGAILASWFGFEWGGLPPAKSQQGEVGRIRRLEAIAELLGMIVSSLGDDTDALTDDDTDTSSEEVSVPTSDETENPV